MPVVVIHESDDPPRWVLIDGYRRVEALREIGEDLVWVDAWDRSVDEALLLRLARAPERGWEAIEEAALLQELSSRYSQRELAQRIGRDVSWVSRRLNLFKALPEELLEAVRTGTLSVWTATRILALLARANSDHAQTLLAQLEKTPLSTRELEQLFAQYQRTPSAQRERLVANPALFAQTLDSRRQAAEDRRLAEGPEGAWCKDLVVTGKILKRLTALAPTLFSPHQKGREGERLHPPYEQAKAQCQRLEQVLEQVTGHDPV
jgi:ParB family chromosome partitioning protein